MCMHKYNVYACTSTAEFVITLPLSAWVYVWYTQIHAHTARWLSRWFFLCMQSGYTDVSVGSCYRSCMKLHFDAYKFAGTLLQCCLYACMCVMIHTDVHVCPCCDAFYWRMFWYTPICVCALAVVLCLSASESDWCKSMYMHTHIRLLER